MWKEKYIAAFNAMEASLQNSQQVAALPHYITTEQRGQLLQLVDQLFPDGKHRAGVWARFGNHFALGKDGKNPRYYSLPATKFDEAMEYLRSLPARMDQNALPETEAINLALAGIPKGSALIVTQPEPGSILIKALPADAQIIRATEFVSFVADPFGVPRSMLPEVIKAAAGRLQ